MVFGIKFAPIFIPLERRLQTFFVIYFMYLIFYRIFFVIPLIIALIYYRFYYLLLIYSIWYIYDHQTPYRGGRRWNWFRRLIGYYFARYFPVTVHKTTDLPPDRKYMFICHPHGIWSYSWAGTFATDGVSFEKMYPGIEVNTITLDGFFKFPIHRDMLLLLGAASASRESIEYILGSPDIPPGRSLALVVGGAAEVRRSYPKTMNLVLKNRKGFVRLAMKHGSSLVPVISFGENDLLRIFPENPPEWYLKAQDFIYGILGVLPPIFYGRGIFQYTFGFLPHRKPLNIVIGNPIHIPEKNPSATRDQVDELHKRYLKELTELYDQHKKQFGYEDVPINFI